MSTGENLPGGLVEPFSLIEYFFRPNYACLVLKRIPTAPRTFLTFFFGAWIAIFFSPGISLAKIILPAGVSVPVQHQPFRFHLQPSYLMSFIGVLGRRCQLHRNARSFPPNLLRRTVLVGPHVLRRALYSRKFSDIRPLHRSSRFPHKPRQHE